MGKRIAIALGALVLVALGAGAWLWHEIFALPQWYTDAEAAPLAVPREPGEPARWIAIGEDGQPLPEEEADEIGELRAAEAILEVVPPADATPTPAPALEPERRRKKAKAHELRGFHRVGKGARAGERAVKASRARYEDGRLEAGAVVDLSRIPRDRMSPKDRDLYERAVTNFPGLTKRDVYVGVEDRPVSRDGFLQLGADPKVRVGNLRYPLAKAAAKLGFTTERLRREIDRELRRLGLVDPG